MTEKTDKNPDDVWLHKQEGYIHYFVHRPTRRCGIHIRGLAELCGVDDKAIRSAIQNAEKADVTGNRSLIFDGNSYVKNAVSNRSCRRERCTRDNQVAAACGSGKIFIRTINYTFAVYGFDAVMVSATTGYRFSEIKFPVFKPNTLKIKNINSLFGSYLSENLYML